MIVVDVETTGLDPRKHSIVSIGAVDYNQPTRLFYVENRIWPGAEISEGALRVNGFTREQVTDPSKPTLAEALTKFFDWAKEAKDRTLGGQNIGRFDALFLAENARIVGFTDVRNRYDELRPHVEVLFHYHTDDLHSIVRSAHRRLGLPLPVTDGLSRISLDKALEFVGVPPEPKPHNALNGAKYEAEVIHRVEKGMHLFDEFARYPVPDYLRR